MSRTLPSLGRILLAASLATVVTVATVLTGSAAYASGGTPSLTRAYVGQARYNPGDSVTVTAVVAETSGAGSWSGPVGFTVSHLGTTVATGSTTATVAASGSQSVTWTTTAPTTDFTGYLVTVTAGSSTTQTAIDVSSDATHFPRPAALTGYPSGTTTAQAQADVDQLVQNYHINAFQFYDWMWRHENPVQRTSGGTLPTTWTAWNGDVISPTTVQNDIAAVHADGALALPYSMSYAGLQNYQSVSGVDPSWALKYASSGQPWAFEMKPNQPNTNLYIFNPANTNWQNFITAKYLDEVNTMGFDGVHLDQLGNWGAMTDTSGNPVDLPAGLASSSPPRGRLWAAARCSASTRSTASAATTSRRAARPTTSTASCGTTTRPTLR